MRNAKFLKRKQIKSCHMGGARKEETDKAYPASSLDVLQFLFMSQPLLQRFVATFFQSAIPSHLLRDSLDVKVEKECVRKAGEGPRPWHV